MRIVHYLNTNKTEVEDQCHNIWIGISLGNKYFSKERIEKYIKWSLQYTKESVLVVIADYIHAVNIEILDRKNPDVAITKVLRLGDKKFEEVKEIIDNLLPDERSKVVLVRWKDALKSDSYKKNLELIKNSFQNNREFREYIFSIVKEGRSDRASTLQKLSESQLSKLAEYILNELPHFIDGVGAYENGHVYTLLPYPGLSKLDTLFIGLQNKTMFSELAEKLHITNKIGILEAYAD